MPGMKWTSTLNSHEHETWQVEAPISNGIYFTGNWNSPSKIVSMYSWIQAIINVILFDFHVSSYSKCSTENWSVPFSRTICTDKYCETVFYDIKNFSFPRKLVLFEAKISGKINHPILSYDRQTFLRNTIVKVHAKSNIFSIWFSDFVNCKSQVSVWQSATQLSTSCKP